MDTSSDLNLLSDINATLLKNPDARQRDIAAGMRLSLGMTNAVLRRFAEKGWLMMKKITPRTARYVLTPDGVNELAHRSYRYMKRTFSEVKTMSAAVEKRIAQAKAEGYTRVVLFGESDIDFIIEWACGKVEIEYVKKICEDNSVYPASDENSLILLGECFDNQINNLVKMKEYIQVLELVEQSVI